MKIILYSVTYIIAIKINNDPSENNSTNGYGLTNKNPEKGNENINKINPVRKNNRKRPHVYIFSWILKPYSSS